MEAPKWAKIVAKRLKESGLGIEEKKEKEAKLKAQGKKALDTSDCLVAGAPAPLALPPPAIPIPAPITAGALVAKAKEKKAAKAAPKPLPVPEAPSLTDAQLKAILLAFDYGAEGEPDVPSDIPEPATDDEDVQMGLPKRHKKPKKTEADVLATTVANKVSEALGVTVSGKKRTTRGPYVPRPEYLTEKRKRLVAQAYWDPSNWTVQKDIGGRPVTDKQGDEVLVPIRKMVEVSKLVAQEARYVAMSSGLSTGEHAAVEALAAGK